jgi:hypothetical protein
MPLGIVSDVDGFAMTMVVILLLSLGVVSLLLASIFRNGKRRDHQVDELLEEVRRSEDDRKIPLPSAAPEAREPWEKDSDWWKKS